MILLILIFHLSFSYFFFLLIMKVVLYSSYLILFILNYNIIILLFECNEKSEHLIVHYEISFIIKRILYSITIIVRNLEFQKNIILFLINNCFNLFISTEKSSDHQMRLILMALILKTSFIFIYFSNSN